MNCTILQRRLTALENPCRPPAELQAHLAQCAACRDWLRRLVELERRVPLLPVPASTAKDEFLARIRSGEAVPRREARPAPRPVAGRVDPQRRDRVIRKVALATALAAGLLMYFGIFAALRMQQQTGSGGPAAPDPLLANLLNRDLRLARAPGKPERFRELADLAEDLRGQAEPLAREQAVDDLKALAKWYRDVVHDGVEKLGPAASVKDRDEVAARLDRAGNTAEQLAGQVSVDCAPPLWDIAIAARNGSHSLQPGARSLRPPGEARSERLSLVGGSPAGRAPLPACAPVLVLAAVSRAQSPAAPLSPAEQARRFGRNRSLIEKLVTGGLQLAGEEDPLKRADYCNSIAQGMADEIRLAVGGHEKGRVAELKQHLHSLLKDGVAENLSQARERIPNGSAEEKGLCKVRDDTEQFLKPVQEVIDATDAGDIKDGLDRVIRAVQPKP
jgi:hypothetical protein